MSSSRNESLEERKVKGQYSLFDEESSGDFLCFDLLFHDSIFSILILDKYYQLSKINGRFEQFFGKEEGQGLGSSIFDFLSDSDSKNLKQVLADKELAKEALIIPLTFQFDGHDSQLVDAYVKAYENTFGERQYCLLLFDKHFQPDNSIHSFKQEIFKTIVDTQEKERIRIGRMLHDSVAQLLYAIRLKMQHVLGDREYQSDDIKSMKELLNEAIVQVRNLSVDLVPSVLQDFGLVQAIHAMANRISTADFKIEVKVPEFCEDFDNNLKLAVFRIIQELLNNAIKHSMATTVAITVICEDHTVNISVTDNGKGFGESLTELQKKGTGLRAIKNRVDLYNGEIKIMDREIGAGIYTTLTI
ncbi:sensor histidine kinase [Sphingobacterium lactis]|uniref:histidine kinase n=1 Tax=Sphingobacterium lactis TaxID=797291 RepID=A0A1H5XI65_9SPHI|nr:sensor histidine kinase [Sphingobacterium lactis]SEG11484.1 Histidine kinase-, DNA gyrase B-, and HSP90-like ATPase [Sphingobacterium lactis]